MKSIITIALCLLYVTSSFAAPDAARVAGDLRVDGIVFNKDNNSVQTKAVVLPTCTSGEVYINSGGVLACGKVMPITNGIATCLGSLCAVSGCTQGFANCDPLKLVCDTSTTTLTSCGGCGVACSAPNECSTPDCSTGVCAITNKPVGTLTSLNVIGNCYKSSCDGAGNITNVIDLSLIHI